MFAILWQRDQFIGSQWDQLIGRAPSWPFFLLCEFLKLFASSFCQRLKKKRKEKASTFVPAYMWSFPFWKRGMKHARMSARKDKSENSKIAVKGWGDMMATVFGFLFPISFCVADCIISVMCLGVDLLSDLWIRVSEPVVPRNNSQVFLFFFFK